MRHHGVTMSLALLGILLLAAEIPCQAVSRPLLRTASLTSSSASVSSVGDDGVTKGHATTTTDVGASYASNAPLGPKEDLIEELPGYGVPPHPQYSGFLDASAAEPGTKLHYWFARSSADDWATRPTVLWLNGGPGSSSLLGFLQENGPLLVNRTGGLMQNPWAWTLESNMIALESPAGVGYSYCEAQLGGGACANTDNSTAQAALAGLVDFFQNKFPSLATNPFFITGESYAGVYVPTLSRAILDHNDDPDTTLKIPLAGLAAGDPCTDNGFQADSMDMLWYGHKHGFVPEDDFDLLWNKCRVRFAHPLTRGKWTGAAAKNKNNKNQEEHVGETVADDEEGAEEGAVFAEVLLKEEEEGDKEEEVEAGTGIKSQRKRMRSRRDPRRRRPLDAKRDPPACVAAHRRFLLASSDAFSQDWKHAWLNDLTLYGPSAAVRDDIPGTLDYQMSQWMMRSDVRAALHVESSPTKQWPGPTGDWSYTSQWSACNDRAPPGTPSMVDFYRYLAPRLQNTIVFNGDTDPCVSYEGTREAIKAVGYEQLPGGAQRPYFFNATEVPLSLLDEKPLLFGPDLAVVPAGPQFGGHVTNYAERLSFVTVHGSGHMVPQFRPRVALHLLRKLLSGKHFSPPLRDDADLASMTHSAFVKELNAWTRVAQSEEYID